MHVTAETKLTLQSAATLIAVPIIYYLFKLVYRVMFHPLAGFPGPKLAALTFKYEYYYDGLKNGRYTEQISQMHAKYGPIVRINPDELHCNDPNFIDDIYAGPGRRRHKSPYFLRAFAPPMPLSAFATAHHDLHRLRRGAINRYFSKASITKLEPLIHNLAQKLCDRLLARAETGEAFDAIMAYSCFATDVISYYCLGQSHGFLEQDEFEPNLHNAVISGCKTLPIARQWPIIPYIISSMPISLAARLSPDIAVYLNYMTNYTDHIHNVKRLHDEGKDFESRGSIFREVLESNLPDNEKTIDRLGAEAGSLIGAGTETTSRTLGVITFYLLTQQSILTKLMAELKTVVKDPHSLPSWATLEKLPYFSATILETIRLSYGVATRLARIAPDEALVYEGTFKPPGQAVEKTVKHVIPPGTPIGMTSVLIHANPVIFPNPDKFIPERWLNDDGTGRRDLDRYMLSFSKGSRQCVGMNLAYCELYIAAAAIILRVLPHVELFDTDEGDVKFDHDMFIPMAKAESLGVRIRGKKV